jgi:hypothetical protein
MITIYERGKLEGKLERQRETALLLIDARFGPVSAEIKQRVEALRANGDILDSFITNAWPRS